MLGSNICVSWDSFIGMRNHTDLVEKERACNTFILPNNILSQFLLPDQLHSEREVEVSGAQVYIILPLLKKFRHKCTHILHDFLHEQSCRGETH